jgi:carbonic anhydrase/acetyltransferase-like protein (isoleucine patch superfamily)
MANAKLDEQGRVQLSEELLAALGWEKGQELLIRTDDDLLLLQPATPTAALREEARRLADTVRGLAGETARLVRDTVTAAKSPAPAPAAPAVTPPSPPPAPAPPGTATVGAFHGITPRFGKGAFLAPGCTVLGDVLLGDDANVWPGAVLRGDVAAVRVGARSNVQDGAVLHVSPQLPCSVGSGVTIGHQATVHGCTVGNHTLIGIHAVVLDGAVVGEHCIIAAGAVVPPGMQVPDGKMVMGVPAKVVRDLTPQEIQRIHWNADSYVSLKNQYVDPTHAPAAPEPPQAAPQAAHAKQGTLPRYECRRAAGGIAVDGSLDDAGWVGVPRMSPLVLANGEGAPTEATEVRACWDAEYLYVSFACKDSDIWATLENRDDPIYDEEVVEVFLCPTGNLQHYYEFEVSPANVLFDAKVFSPEGDRATMLVDKEWNAKRIQTGVRVSGTLNDRTAHDLGWIVELGIAFSDLGLSGPPEPGTIWRANFYRIERGAVTEFSAWSPTFQEPAEFHLPACFGELVFVDDQEEV